MLKLTWLFFSCKRDSIFTNVRSFVSHKPKPLNTKSSSSFIIQPSSFMILHSWFFIHPSFISRLLSFSACLKLNFEMKICLRFSCDKACTKADTCGRMCWCTKRGLPEVKGKSKKSVEASYQEMVLCSIRGVWSDIDSLLMSCVMPNQSFIMLQ